MNLTKDDNVLSNLTVYSSGENQAKLYIPNRLFLTYTEKILNYSIFLHVDDGNDEWLTQSKYKLKTWAQMELNSSSEFFYRASRDQWRPISGSYLHVVMFYIIYDNRFETI